MDVCGFAMYSLYIVFSILLLKTTMALQLLIGIIVLILMSGIRIAQEYQRSVVFRLGRFKAIKGPGIYWIIPFIEWQQRVDIRTKTVDLEQEETEIYQKLRTRI